MKRTAEENSQQACPLPSLLHRTTPGDLIELACSGGTFALYSLLCRHARLSLVGNQVATDLQLSTYQLDIPNKRLARASKIKERLERSKELQITLIVIVLVGTCLVIGDGVLTPAISGKAARASLRTSFCALEIVSLYFCRYDTFVALHP